MGKNNNSLNGQIPETDIVKLFMLGIDAVSAVRRQGSAEAYLELIDLFNTDGKRRLGLLQELIRTKDLERYEIEVHGLKSAAASIGAAGLSELSRLHEQHSSDIKYVEENSEALLDCYKKVLSETERILKNWKYGQYSESRDTVDLKPVETEEMQNMVREALAYLEDFHSKESAESVDKLLGYDVPADIRSGLERIQVMLKMYEDDQAEEALREIVKSFDDKSKD